MPDTDVIAELQLLGISAYEAKAYSALVAPGEPLTGYEVAKRSRIPRSTVYETLGKLVARGAVYEVRSNGDSTEYICLPPQVLFERMERDFQRSVDSLKAAMPNLATTPKAHLIHNINGRKPLLHWAEDIVASSKNTLFVSGWPSEIEPLKLLIRSAEGRGVDISVVSFGPDQNPVGKTIEHRFSEPEVARENLGPAARHRFRP